MPWAIPVPRTSPGKSPGWADAIRYGSGIPADGLGNLGDRYFDTTAQRWYLKRWVANPNGQDTITVNTPAASLNESHSVEFLFRAQGGFTSGVFKPFMYRNCGASNTVNYQILLNGPSTPTYELYAEFFGSYSSPLPALSPVFDGAWHKVTLKIAGPMMQFFVDNALKSTRDLSAYTPATTATKMLFGDISGLPPAQTGLQMANIRVIRQGNPVCTIPMDDGSGATVRDISGMGNNGTFTDAAPTTFWLQTWVPLDLL